MENLIENSPSATIYVRKGGEIVIFNAAAEKLTGYRKEEVIGKLDVRDLYRPGEAKQIMKNLRSNAFGRPGILDKDMVWIDKNGVEIPIRLHGAILIEDGEEEASGWILGIITDQREKKALERQLLRSERARVDWDSSLRASLMKSINHSQGCLHLLTSSRKNSRMTEQNRKDLEVIVRETSRIRNIVKGVLRFRREKRLCKKNHTA